MGKRLWLFFFVIVPLVLVTSFYILDPQLATDRFVQFIKDILEPFTMAQHFEDFTDNVPCDFQSTPNEPCP